MTESPRKEKICLSREIDGNKIEVWIYDENEFSNGFELLQRLCNRFTVEQAKLRFLQHWSQNEDAFVLSQAIGEGPHRVALALFRTYPECRRQVEIQNETGLSPGSVSKIFAGKQGDLDSWFTRCNGNWTLSREGLENILSGVIVPEES